MQKRFMKEKKRDFWVKNMMLILLSYVTLKHQVNWVRGASTRSKCSQWTDPECVVDVMCLPNKKRELQQCDNSSARAHDAEQAIEVRCREPVVIQNQGSKEAVIVHLNGESRVQVLETLQSGCEINQLKDAFFMASNLHMFQGQD